MIRSRKQGLYPAAGFICCADNEPNVIMSCLTPRIGNLHSFNFNKYPVYQVSLSGENNDGAELEAPYHLPNVQSSPLAYRLRLSSPILYFVLFSKDTKETGRYSTKYKGIALKVLHF